MTKSQEYLKEKVNLSNALLKYIDEEDNSEENLANLTTLLENQHIKEERGELKILLTIISSISCYRHRLSHFFTKIETLLKMYKEEIKNYYTNREIYDIFQESKRVLLFLLNEKIIIIDEYIFTDFFSFKKEKNNYPQYFLPEIKPFISKSLIKIDEKLNKILNEFQIPENFEELRLKGENEDQLCEIIRKDDLNEFIRFVEQESIPLDFKIEASIYETNSCLNYKEENLFSFDTTKRLTEYAAFFGSIQIYKYLIVNNAEKSPTKTLNYAIYSNNIELVHIIEERIEEKYIEGNYILDYANDAIKCYNNDMAEYFIGRYREKPNESLKYQVCNFGLIQEDKIDDDNFYFLCQYGYYKLVELLLKEKKFDLNNATREYHAI